MAAGRELAHSVWDFLLALVALLPLVFPTLLGGVAYWYWIRRS